MIPTKHHKIKPRSKKRAAQEREYAKLRKGFLLANPICQVGSCGCEATDIHHKAGRIGKLLTDVSLFLGCCRAHHNYIENHPIEAKVLGYSVSRLANNFKMFSVLPQPQPPTTATNSTEISTNNNMAKKKMIFKVHYQGSFLVLFTLEDAITTIKVEAEEAIKAGEEDFDCKLTTEMMTDKEIEAMPEFDGW